MNSDFTTICTELGHVLQQKRWLITTAESCTGGLVAELITSIAGSSTWFERGFVTYSNLAKHEMLGVQTTTLQQYGAVSEKVVKEMAAGALKYSHAHVSVALTGIAGPGGGTKDKPVGLVWFGFALPSLQIVCTNELFFGDRQQIRASAAEFALSKLVSLIKIQEEKSI